MLRSCHVPRSIILLATLLSPSMGLAGCGGGSSGLPRAAAVQAAPPAPTPPSVVGPASASTTITFSSSNPTVTLPTVGNVASQITFPSNFAPDGTQLSITVTAGGTTATSSAVRSIRRPLTVGAPPSYTVTVITGSTTPVVFTGGFAVTVASPIAVGTLPTQNSLSYLSLSVPASTQSLPTFTVLGTVGADSAANGIVIFSIAPVCTPLGGDVTQVNGTSLGSGNAVQGQWNVTTSSSGSSAKRSPRSASACAPPTSVSPSVLGAGALYVSDPGSGAVLLFSAGAFGDVAPFVPLTAAPPIATDFAGELVTGANAKGTTAFSVATINIRPYGSTSLVDQIQGTAALANNGVGADPLGVHVAIFDAANCTLGAGGRTGTCPAGIEIFDRAQGGNTVPSGGWSQLNLFKLYTNLWLDGSDDAFLPGEQGNSTASGSSRGCGAFEFVPSFGATGSPTTYAPYRAVYPNGCGSIAQVTTDTAGNLYLARTGCCIDVYAPGTGGAVAATYELTSPGANNPTAGFNGPTGVAVDPSGNVYISSPEVLQQNSDGSLTLLAAAAVYVYGPASTWAGNASPLGTISGPNTGLIAPGQLALVPASPTTPPNQLIQVNPMAVTFTASAQSQTVAVSEAGFSGTFAQNNSCGGTATVIPATGGFTVTAVAAGTCFATISDGQGNSGRLGITVTTTGFTLSGTRRR